MSLKISNGTVVDGTGKPRFKATVLVEDGVIAGLTDGSGPGADVELDASGCVVAPGFIDAHSHSDYAVLADPLLPAKLMQGVTTDVVGNCGLGFYPVNDIVFAYYDKLVKNLIGVTVEKFERLGDFTSALEARGGTGPNLGFLIPHGNVRAYVMGMRDGEPRPDELRAMEDLVDQGMRDGALGLSTGLVYPPGALASTRELVALAKVVARHGGLYASHIRNEGSGVLGAVLEAIEIGREAGCAVQISHMKVGTPLGWKKRTRRVMEVVEQARASGLDVTGDVYPYDSANTELAAIALPAWVFDGPPEEFSSRLRDPALREKIIKDFFQLMATMVNLPGVVKVLPKKWLLRRLLALVKKRVVVTAVKNNHEAEGMTLGDALKRYYPGCDVLDAVMDFIADEEGAVNISMHLMNQSSVDQFLKWPFTMVGSDSIVPVGGGNCHPRTYGTFPRVLSDVVGRGVLSLEQAIYKMTKFPATKFGFSKRGEIREGFHADLVVFDPGSIHDKAIFGDACQYPEGIKYIIVNGELAAENGKPTGIRAGKFLRRESYNSEEN
ncbi:MAG: N-acyl-D-amino-acid deacylase family protein [Promethearchaeota archaeon]